MTANAARDQILGDIKRALRGEGKSVPILAETAESAVMTLQDTVSEIRGRCERLRNELAERFEAESTRIGVRFYRAANNESALEYIESICSSAGMTRIVAWEAEVIAGIGLGEHLREKDIEFLTESTDSEFIRKAESANLGVSGVDYALSDTATLVLRARNGQARSISLLPPVHLAIVKPEQLLSGLSDLFPLLRADAHEEGTDLSSAVTFITGPSRTADIELTLVVGVHGPQQLHVVLLEN